MEIQALRTKQDGSTLYVVAIPATDLIERSRPDVFTIENGSEHGYQRAPERARALQIARFLQGPQVLLPTAIVLGVRCQLPYDEETGLLTIPDGVTLYEVDGQHRTAGFRAAIAEQGVQRLGDFPVVTVIMDDTNEETEASQFRIINETAKKVRTDLARRILARISRVAPLAVRRQASMERRWEIEATKVIEVLQRDPQSPWYERIQMPYQRKSPSHIIREKSFGDSLQPLLSTFPFERFSERKIAEGVNEYWMAWKRVMDQAGDANEYSHPLDEPREFVIMKAAPGVLGLHRVLRHLWSVFERRGEPFIADRIELALAGAGRKVREYDQLQEDFTTRRAWHGQDGTFALYGGLKGATGLAHLVIEYLNEAGYALE